MRDRHQNGGQGMNWIRPAKRLAIYLRDGLACCYCGEGIEEGAQMTLDHLVPHSRGGKNDAMNLVTACHRCNSARGARPWRRFAAQVAAYVEGDVDEIIRHVLRTRARRVDVARARELIALRGGLSAACRSAKQKVKP